MNGKTAAWGGWSWDLKGRKLMSQAPLRQVAVNGEQKAIACLLAGVCTTGFPLCEGEKTRAQPSSAAGASGGNSGTSLQPSLLSSA